MARKNDIGKYILSAGEIGEYTVCPESWRLKNVQKVQSKYIERIRTGASLHQKWAEDYSQTILLSRKVRLVALLLLLAFAIYLTLKIWGS